MGEIKHLEITRNQTQDNPQSRQSGQIIKPQFKVPAMDKEAEKHMKLAEMHERMQASGVPSRYKNLRFKDIKMRNAEIREATNTIRGYVDTIHRQVELGSNGFLCGSPGTGKTMLGCLLVMYAISRGYVAMYTTAFKMIQKIRKGYAPGESVDRFIREFVSKDLLVIDEIGVQRGSEDERVLLYQVIDDRSLERRPTVIISNSKNPVDDGYLDLRVLDRIQEGEFSFSLEFDAESYRK